MEKLAACNILIVDDNQEMTKLCELMLSSLGAAVSSALSYDSACLLLEKTSPDIILCDVFLDNQKLGTDLMKQHLHRTPQTIFIMMTGLGDIKTAIDCLRDGAYDFLLKPFNLLSLQKIIQNTRQRQIQQIEARDHMERRMRTLAEFSDNNPNPILRVSKEGVVQYSNSAALRYFPGWSAVDKAQLPTEVLEHCRKVIETYTPQKFELHDKENYWEFTLLPTKTGNGIFIFVQNTTDRRTAEAELFRTQAQAIENSLHDPLTGLPNRRLFEQRAEIFMERCGREKRVAGFLIIDLDNFKEINDFFGHKAGDRVLQKVANILKQHVQHEELVSRWGGDEFVAFILGNSHQEIENRCRVCRDLIVRTLRELYPIHHLSVSIGLSFYPDDGETSDLLMQRADHALYMVKSRGKNGIMMVSDADRHWSLNNRQSMLECLYAAVVNGTLGIAYQPIFNLTGSTVHSIEILSRWRDDKYGDVPPNMFIPLAQQKGLLSLIDRHSMRKGLLSCNQWLRKGHTGGISLNITKRTIEEENICALIIREIELRNIPKHLVTLEISEKLPFHKTEQAGKNLIMMKEAGIQISLDDYGIGTTALEDLIKYPIDEVKVAREIVKEMHRPNGEKVLRHVRNLCSDTNIRAVAEGIETQEQMERLIDMGYQYGQGYYLSVPVETAYSWKPKKPETMPILAD